MWGRTDMGFRVGWQDFWPPLLRLARLIPGVEYVQAQRARGVLAREVVGAMQAAGLDAFVGNASEQLAMANLASLPTVAVPVALAPLPDAPASARRQVLSAGIFGPPDGCGTLGNPDACSWMPVSSWPWPSWLSGLAERCWTRPPARAGRCSGPASLVRPTGAGRFNTLMHVPECQSAAGHGQAGLSGVAAGRASQRMPAGALCRHLWAARR